MGSTGRNILIGWAAAIGVAALLAVGSCIGFTVWLNRPGHLTEPEKLLGADTSGFIEWTLHREDPGTLAILDYLPRQLTALLQPRGGTRHDTGHGPDRDTGHESGREPRSDTGQDTGRE